MPPKDPQDLEFDQDEMLGFEIYTDQLYAAEAIVEHEIEIEENWYENLF